MEFHHEIWSQWRSLIRILFDKDWMFSPGRGRNHYLDISLCSIRISHVDSAKERFISIWTSNALNKKSCQYIYIYIYVYLITLYIYIHHYIPVYTHIPLMSPYISSPFFFSQKKTTPPKTGRWSRAVERCRDLWWWALVTWLATKNRTDGTPQVVVNSKGIRRKFQGKSRLVKYYTYSLVKIPVVSNVFLKIMFTPYCTWGK